MTETAATTTAPAASANGQHPDSETGGGGLDVSERMLGLFGMAFAIAVGLIAIDLLSGGAVSRLASRTPAGDDDDHG